MTTARLLSTCARNPIYVDVTFWQLDISFAYWRLWRPVILSCKLIYLNIMSNKRRVANFSFSRDWKCPTRIDRKQSCENLTIFSYEIDVLVDCKHVIQKVMSRKGIWNVCCVMCNVYAMNWIGLSTEPWGTPVARGIGADWLVLVVKTWVWPER